MKRFLIEPKMKKSVVEEQTFRKVEDGITFILNREMLWRTGSFVISVPETDEEIHNWLEERGWSQEDWDEGFVDEGSFLPDADDEAIELDDYDFEMEHTWDGIYEDWTVTASPEVDEDVLEEMQEHAQEIYAEDYEESLYAEGWEEAGFCTCIYNGAVITEMEDEDDD